MKLKCLVKHLNIKDDIYCIIVDSQFNKRIGETYLKYLPTGYSNIEVDKITLKSKNELILFVRGGY